MADIISDADRERKSRALLRTVPPISDAEEGALIAFIELIFFAYRDFVSDADVVLEEFGFGRAHHRVLHFVNRQPGLRVADLLDILKITKQSLAPVLKQLVEKGYIVQRAGVHDRRERLLYPTEEGKVLFRRLVEPQMERVKRALPESKIGGSDVVERFLFDMIVPEERVQVRNLIGCSSAGSIDDEAGA